MQRFLFVPVLLPYFAACRRLTSIEEECARVKRPHLIRPHGFCAHSPPPASSSDGSLTGALTPPLIVKRFSPTPFCLDAFE